MVFFPVAVSKRHSIRGTCGSAEHITGHIIPFLSRNRRSEIAALKLQNSHAVQRSNACGDNSAHVCCSKLVQALSAMVFLL